MAIMPPLAAPSHLNVRAWLGAGSAVLVARHDADVAPVRPTVINEVVVGRGMSQELRQARTELENAVERADDDVREDLRETAAAFAEYASDDADPDHAVFDEHLNTLRQARRRATGDVETQWTGRSSEPRSTERDSSRPDLTRYSRRSRTASRS